MLSFAAKSNNQIANKPIKSKGHVVIKRDGREEDVHFDKITTRIQRLCYGLNEDYVDPILISQKVCAGVTNRVTTYELDELAAETAAHLTSLHPDFGLLAARIAVSNLHKSTLNKFSEVAKILYNYIEPRTQLPASMLADSVFYFIQDNAEVLNNAIVHDRDFGYDFFGKFYVMLLTSIMKRHINTYLFSTIDINLFISQVTRHWNTLIY
jgi:hypothetical protein